MAGPGEWPSGMSLAYIITPLRLSTLVAPKPSTSTVVTDQNAQTGHHCPRGSSLCAVLVPGFSDLLKKIQNTLDTEAKVAVVSSWGSHKDRFQTSVPVSPLQGEPVGWVDNAGHPRLSDGPTYYVAC